ncbi:MAG: hypothetical protein HZA00_07060 [Nitrospinae bacterium]|nr:hypothetical protein [Nitrospinota bacterium]
MGNISIEKLIQDEIEGIPEDKLHEVYDLLHYFRIGIEKENIEDVKGLRLASEKKFDEVWKGEKDEIWESYL